jgi:hypothetical protein
MRWITQVAMIATSLTAAGLRLDPMFDPLRAIGVSKSSARKSRNKDLTTDHPPPVAAATYGAASTDNTDEWGAIIGE